MALEAESSVQKAKYDAMDNEADQADSRQVLEKAYRSGHLGEKVDVLVSNMKERRMKYLCLILCQGQP